MPGETGHSDIARVSPPVPARVPNASQPAHEEPSYYDISILQIPTWKWEIVGYFYLGGLSGGAYVLSRLADRFGGSAGKNIARTGAWVSFLAFLPCPPLLIKDLGDPARFHHMLRVFKPNTPMSLGSWILTSYSAFMTGNLARQVAHDLGWVGPRSHAPITAADALLNLADDLLGIPLALMLAGYTGVLLSCTANPLWTQNPWIGPLFSASAMSTGAGAIQAATNLLGGDTESPVSQALEKLDTVAHVGEAISLVGCLRHDPVAARSLTSGPMRKHLITAGALLVASEVLKHIDAPKPTRKLLSLASAAAGLAAGYHIRHMFIYGGHVAARNPGITRASSSAARRGVPSAKFPYPSSQRSLSTGVKSSSR